MEKANYVFFSSFFNERPGLHVFVDFMDKSRFSFVFMQKNMVLIDRIKGFQMFSSSKTLFFMRGDQNQALGWFRVL